MTDHNDLTGAHEATQHPTGTGPVADGSPTVGGPVHPDAAGAPRWALLLLGGGAAVVLGSFLPWVRILVFEISGVTARWGIVTLLAGAVALVAAYQAWKGGLLKASTTKPLLIAAVVAGVLAVLVPAAVALELKESVAESEVEDESGEELSSGDSEIDDEFFDPEFEAEMEEFERSMAEAFAVKLGFGLWLTLIGGVLMLAGAVDALRNGPGRRHSA